MKVRGAAWLPPLFVTSRMGDDGTHGDGKVQDSEQDPPAEDAGARPRGDSSRRHCRLRSHASFRRPGVVVAHAAVSAGQGGG